MASQCPKCHRALEEDYICCAGVEFQWVCVKCYKRSRGFVIPFGACNMCGGSLERSDVDEHPSQGRLLALQEAIQLEINAVHFYHRLAEAVDDPQTSDFFESLSEMEKGHAKELCERYHVDLKDDIYADHGGALPTPFFDDVSVFANTGDVSRLYDCAISLEKKTRDFFLEKAELMAAGPEKTLYLELAAEEGEHIALLESERDR